MNYTFQKGRLKRNAGTAKPSYTYNIHKKWPILLPHQTPSPYKLFICKIKQFYYPTTPSIQKNKQFYDPATSPSVKMNNGYIV